MTVLLLIAAMAGLAWAAVYLRRGSLIAGCVAFLLSAAIFGHDFWHASIGPLTLTLDRLLAMGLIATYVLHRRLGKAEPKPIQPVDVALISLMVLLVISTLTHDWRGDSPDQVPPHWRLTVGYLIPAVVYWIARQSRLRRETLQWIWGALVAYGAYLAVTGLLEIAGQWSLVFPRHVADPLVGQHFGRARGPMVNSVSYGMSLAVCLLGGWMLWPSLRRGGQLALLLLAPVFLAGLFFCYTRSVWMGTVLGLVIAVGLTLRGRLRVAVLGSMVAGGLLFAMTNMDRLVAFDRSDNTAQQTRESVHLRAGFAYVSWQMFLDRPLLGFGFGQFATQKLAYLGDRSTELQLQTLRPYSHHNTLLSVLTETGAIGLTLFVILLFGWTKAAWRLVRGTAAPDWVRLQGAFMLAVLGVYGCQLAFHEVSYSPLDNALVFFLAGLTVGLRPRAEASARYAATPPLTHDATPAWLSTTASTA